MVKANREYDISFIEPTNSTEIGLMLAQKKGVPIYSEYDDPALAQQFFSGDPSYGNLPPEKELQIAQDNWQAGAGQEVYDPADPYRYAYADSVDLRFKGKAVLGPGTTTVAIPTGVAKAFYNFNDDLYIGVTKTADDDGALCRLNGIGTAFGEVKSFTDKGITDLIEHTDGKGYIALGGTNKYYYMTAELVVETCDAAWDELTETDVTPSVDETTLAETNESGYMNGTGSAKFEIAAGLDAGDLIATHDMTSVDLTGYTDITFWIKSSISLDANDLQLLLSSSAECASPTEELNISALAFGDWTSIHVSFADPTDLGAIISIGLKMVVNKGAFNLWIDDVRVGSYTESSQADGKADFFTLVDDKLWKGVKPNQLASAIAPETDGWSAITKVGSTAQNITDLAAESGQLFIMKEDTPYYLDTEGNVHKLIPELKTLESSTGGANSLVWQGKIYMPYGEQGLVEYASGVGTWRSPSLYMSEQANYGGRIDALAADDQYLYAIVETALAASNTAMWILAGRQENVGGVDRWVWHPLARTLAIRPAQIAFISSVYKKRLYACQAASYSFIYYAPVTTNYSDIDRDTDYTFAETGNFYAPWLHANLKGDNKAYIKLTLTLSDTSETEFFAAYYRLRGNTAWTSIGNFKTSPTTTQYIPADTNSVNPISTMIQLRFYVRTGDTSTTPVMYGYDCRAVWYPAKRWLIGCSIRCADNVVRKDGSDDTQTADQINTAITDAVETTWPFTLYPPEYAESGDEIKVKILRAEKVMTKNEVGKNPEYQYNLLLAKTPLA